METPKELVREIEEGRPGRRFERLYRKRRQSKHGKLKNRLFIAAGALVIAAAAFTFAVPIVPTDIVTLVGVALIAQGSLVGARTLDRFECWFRDRFAGVVRLWKRLTKPAKVAIYVVWLGVLGGVSYWIHHAMS